MAVIEICAIGVSASGDLAGLKKSPAAQLVVELEKLGHQVVDLGSQNATHFLSLDHHERVFSEIVKRFPIKNRILFIQEPEVVQPANYAKRTMRKYGAKVTITPAGAGDYCPWPQVNWTLLNFVRGSRIKNSIALVNANKSSLIKGSLYGLRRKVVRRIAKNGIRVDIAGPGWDKSLGELFKLNAIALAFALKNRKLPQMKEIVRGIKQSPTIYKHGPVDNKFEFLSTFEFAVVVENSATYVSEKLFDAVIAGCVPLYCGPNLSDFDIPAEVAVQLPPNPQAFVKTVAMLTEEEKQSIVQAGTLWLAQPETIEKWVDKYAYRKIAESIDQYLK